MTGHKGLKMSKRKNPKDNAPGDLVREIERLTGWTTFMTDSRFGKGHRAVIASNRLEVEFTSPSSRFRVITTPEFLRDYHSVLEFLTAHAIGGIVTGYKVAKGVTIQWFDIMPRFAAHFVESVAVCAQEQFVEHEVGERIDRVPGGLYEALVASQWVEKFAEYHPALVNPGSVSILRHVDDGVDVVFAESGVWVGFTWPFENSTLIKAAKAMPVVRFLVDKGPDGWHSGHWGDHGARSGWAWARWDGSIDSLQRLMRTVKPSRKSKARGIDPTEFDSHHPRPTAYSYTIH